jgi:RecA-family ATPase
VNNLESIAETEDVDTTTASDIESRSVAWLFEPYLPMGTVSILIGDGGEGKSFASLAIAAAVTRGTPLFGASTALPPSDVIIQNAENPWPFVIKPRLEMLGADCNRVHRINDAEKPLTLTDSRIEAAIRKHNARLVIADPIQSYLGDSLSMNRAESVRPMLTHLERVAERTQSAILLIGHISKGRGKAQHRGLGSVDIVNSVPSVLCLGKAEGLDRDIRAIAALKNNFAELGATQLFKLNKSEGFQWLGESNVTPEDIMNFSVFKQREDKSKIDEAADFLTELLADGGISATDAIGQAEEMGISKRTLDRAKAELGVKPRRVDNHWIWYAE